MRLIPCLPLFLAAWLVGCSSSPTRSRITLQEAIRHAQAGDTQAARAALGSACLARNPAACHALGQNIPPLQKRLGILQGPTNDSITTVALLYAKPITLSVLLWDPTEGSLLAPKIEKDFGRAGSNWAVRQLRFENLKSDRPYMLQVLDSETHSSLLDARELWTLDASKPSLKFAATSCIDDAFMEPEKEMWEGLLSSQPDLILFNGDNVYADRPGVKGDRTNPDQLWQRYAETRSALTIFKQYRLVPIFAIWDDHDYGTDDGNRHFPGQASSKDTFLSFFPQSLAEGILSSGPGIASAFVVRGQRFILTDGRSFRSGPQDAQTETHWGAEQENWIFDQLKKPLPTWIISGDQFFGKYHSYESYEGRHPQSFQKWLTRMKTVKAPFALISGDRHLAEIMEIAPQEMGRKTYEITSSAIHARTFPDAWKKSPNPRQIAGVSGTLNFAIVDSSLEVKKNRTTLLFTVEVFGPRKSLLFEKRLLVK